MPSRSPAPGDPYYLNYSYNPMLVGVAPPPIAGRCAGCWWKQAAAHSDYEPPQRPRGNTTGR